MPRALSLTFAIVVLSSLPGTLSAQQPRPVKEQGEISTTNPGNGTADRNRMAQSVPGLDKAPSDRLRPDRGDNAERAKRKTDEWWRKFTTDPQATFAGAIFLLTCALVWLAYRQLDKIQATVDAMNRTITQVDKAQRAWIVPEEWLSRSRKDEPSKPDKKKEVTCRPIADGQTLVIVPFRNIGKIPGFNARIAVASTVYRRSGGKDGAILQRIVRKDGWGSVRQVFGVDDFGDNNALLRIFCGSQHDIDGIAEGFLVLRVNVRLAYNDPLGTKGRTKFVMTYHPQGDRGFFTFSGTNNRLKSVMK